jgi:hypothetical protein
MNRRSFLGVDEDKERDRGFQKTLKLDEIDHRRGFWDGEDLMEPKTDLQDIVGLVGYLE